MFFIVSGCGILFRYSLKDSCVNKCYLLSPCFRNLCPKYCYLVCFSWSKNLCNLINDVRVSIDFLLRRCFHAAIAYYTTAVWTGSTWESWSWRKLLMQITCSNLKTWGLTKTIILISWFSFMVCEMIFGQPYAVPLYDWKEVVVQFLTLSKVY